MRRERLEELGSEELERLIAEAREILARRASVGRPAPRSSSDRKVVGRRRGSSGRWLQLERVRCGKVSCKRCAAGEGHGPYFYLYYTNAEGRYTSKYVGKLQPPELVEEFGPVEAGEGR
jgi:hypothetical protein